MHILLISIGTRGDMEPFLAIGELLKANGHKVTAVFPEQFKNLATNTGLDFFSLGPEFLELINSRNGRALMGGSSGINKLIGYLKLANSYSKINKKLNNKQLEAIEQLNPDKIIHNGKAIIPMIWGLENKNKTVLISPVPYLLHPVKNRPHAAFRKNLGVLNQFSYKLANYGLIRTIYKTLKNLKIGEGISKKDVLKGLTSGKTIYTVSPTLFPKPSYWPENANVLGYHERNKTHNWQPEEALNAFIQKHKKILFVTFGSMNNNTPEEKTRIILESVKKSRIPTIINTAAGGLIKPEIYPTDYVYFTDNIPYDWIFPKVFGVIHHGGSGTTHTAIKYGCTSMIIPHIIDQFIWNDILANLRVGPKGMRIASLNKPELEGKIEEMWYNPEFKQKTKEVAESMNKEDFRDLLYKELV